MNIQRATPINELLAKIIFLVLPTVFISYFLLWNANEYFSILRDQAVQQSLYFAVGICGATLFYAFRFRFIPTFAILITALFLIYKGLDNSAVGEFDMVKITFRFYTFSIIFTFGWLIGWGFTRLRYWSIFVAALILTIGVLLTAKAQVDTLEKLMWSFSPAVLYAIYIIYTAEQIYNYKDKSQRFWWFLTRRLVLFTALAALLFAGVSYLLKDDIQQTVDQYGGQGEDGENSMLEKNADSTFNIKDYSKLRGSLGRTNELLFCARIDNYFAGTDIPNPLYLTAFYYTKFDTLTETFERDEQIPFNDLYEPDPSQLPMFMPKADSSVIKNSLSDKLRTVVEVEIYNKSLDPSTYLAPHTGFFVQPITIEKDYRDQFKSAFRTKSFVSELNSAYFIYNSKDPQIKAFQKQRFNVLRKAKGYGNMDQKFMDYYTYMPGDQKFQQIQDLAKGVTKNATTTLDKVLAIRDHFLKRDEDNKQIFSYTDNPGIPDIPSASKLQYFLFENKQGYCAYYAGATLFMLRSLGIPSRIAVGFMTVDRSDKNKGWYWYYADQAHAWVQVYFPGYGWLDFDTTVGNDDAEESPQPDGTPPMQPPKAWLAAEGIVERIDTIKKRMDMKVRTLIFKDKEYSLDSFVVVDMDMKIAAIYRDSIAVPLNNIEVGDKGTAVSYALAFKRLKEKRKESGERLAKRMPKPAPIDEVYLKREDIAKEKESPKTDTPPKSISAKDVLLIILLTIISVILLIFAMPFLIFVYFSIRHNTTKNGEQKAYWAYQTASYYLNQIGINRGSLTPMQYARDVVDPNMNTKFVSFMNIYLKQKYANQRLNEHEIQQTSIFLKPFIKRIRSVISFSKRAKGFLNPFRSIAFFYSNENNNTETKR